jgi:hypothetical protein
MSNDRHQEEQISAVYQDLANERVPEQIDNNVLRMAKANAERPRYSRWVAWSRPLAWAATVALCLAITLELTQPPVFDDVAAESTPAENTAPAALRAPDLQKDKLEQTPQKSSPARSAAKRTDSDSEADSAGRMRQYSDLAEADSIEEVTAAPAMAIEVKEASELRRESQSFSAGYAASNAPAADMAVDECSEESRAEPESWLACINELEASGAVEAASRQRENLIEVFPDFKLP